jgi:hypothetical protein
VLALRKQFMNPGIFLYYKKPLMVVEGRMQYVWDEKGKRYLDGLGGIVTISVIFSSTAVSNVLTCPTGWTRPAPSANCCRAISRRGRAAARSPAGSCATMSRSTA